MFLINRDRTVCRRSRRLAAQRRVVAGVWWLLVSSALAKYAWADNPRAADHSNGSDNSAHSGMRKRNRRAPGRASRRLPASKQRTPGGQRRKLYPEAQPATSFFNNKKLTGNWFGLRDRLQHRGIDFEGSITTDFSKSFFGGLRTNYYAARYLLDISATVHTKQLFGLPGGKFYADFQNRGGPNAQNVEVGDIQGFSNIDAFPAATLARMWYQQNFIHKHIRVRVGSMYVDDQFLYPDYGQDFLNPSMAHDPSVFVLPTYPQGEPGIDAFLYPKKSFYLAAGIFDGHLHQVLNYDPGGIFFIAETGLRWKIGPDKLDGKLKLGLWDHTGTFQTLNGAPNVSFTNGWYSVLSQTFWKPRGKHSNRSFGAFLQVGGAQPNVSVVDGHIGGGISWTGFLPGRPNDELGLGITYARLSPEAGLPYNFENDYEAFYKIQVTPAFVVQPDLQYIQHPGGNLPNALVGTVRLILNF